MTIIVIEKLTTNRIVTPLIPRGGSEAEFLALAMSNTTGELYYGTITEIYRGSVAAQGFSPIVTGLGYNFGALAVHPLTNVLFYAMGHKIYKYQSGNSVLFAGSESPGNNGNGDLASFAAFNTPEGLAFNKNGSILYVSDTQNSVVKAIDMQTTVTTVVAEVNLPKQITVDSWGRIFVVGNTDENSANYSPDIFMINSTGVSLFYTVPALNIQTLQFISGLVFDLHYNSLYIMTRGDGSMLTRIQFDEPCKGETIGSKCLISRNSQSSICSTFYCSLE